MAEKGYLVNNKCSMVIWKTIKNILSGEEISFFENNGVYGLTPKNVRWKNFFLNNCYWAHSGKSQKDMILLSEGIENAANKIKFFDMDVKEYIKTLEKLEFQVLFTDHKESVDILREKHPEHIIIVQNNEKIEEFATTIAAKLFFMGKGYLVGNFEIPLEEYERDTGYGIPDIVGIKGNFVNSLKSYGIVQNGGDESDVLIWSQLKSSEKPIVEEEEIVVCEVKDSGSWTKAFEQLYKRNGNPGYLKSHCFNKGYACFGVLVASDADIKKNYKAEFEAGSLVFSNRDEPLMFTEDQITRNPSSSRRQSSVEVQKTKQNKLLSKANNEIARLLVASFKIGRLIPNIEKMTVNQFYKEINHIKIENVIHSLEKNRICEE